MAHFAVERDGGGVTSCIGVAGLSMISVVLLLTSSCCGSIGVGASDIVLGASVSGSLSRVGRL